MRIRIKELRARYDLTQEDLARRLAYEERGSKFDLLNVKYKLCAIILEGYSVESVGD